MRTTATFIVTTTPLIARSVVAEFLQANGIIPELQPDWDGTPLWSSCAVRFGISGPGQDYSFDVNIRGRVDDEGRERASIEIRQDACGYRGEPMGPRRSEVQMDHLDDALRDALSRRGVLEHVEQFS
jgi:hypothetical protein